MKTYKIFESYFEKAKADMELLQNIVSVGIPKKQAVYFNSISVERKFYVGHNKFIETHGKIVVRFNKGEFKKYMAMCEEMYKALAIKANASKYISLVDNIIKPNIDLKNSRFNKSKGIGCVYIEKQFV